ncbi:MAG: translation initiation factor [Prevotellaceae bacterium]|jgi:translation initiation factor 1|nr:translation initiation factor [Prevotellaceae bacterium]
MTKERKERINVVYSTNPDYNYEYDVEENIQESIAPAKQNLTVRLDKKQRGGKKVTLVQGFAGSEDDLKTLGKSLKNKCGVGGTVKDGEILIQGDFRDKIVEYLVKEGYKAKRGN